MKQLLLILSFTLGLATTAFSNTKFDNWAYSDLPPIQVSLFDQATDGCWTNIGEVQRYAEDKLRLAGADVVENKTGGVNLYTDVATFSVHVFASRNGFGFCWGMMKMELVISSRKGSIIGIFTYANTAATLMRNENVNNDILTLVGKAIPDWGLNN